MAWNLKGERNGIVSWNKDGSPKPETGCTEIEDISLPLPFYLKINLKNFNWVINSHIDCPLCEFARIVKGLGCLKIHVACFMMTSGIDISHFIRYYLMQ